jgi:hypothetical protein
MLVKLFRPEKLQIPYSQPRFETEVFNYLSLFTLKNPSAGKDEN